MSGSDLRLESFFASRSGVCVYVTVAKRAFRVQFAAPDAIGVVADHGHEAESAEEARRVARLALREHAQALAPLFEKVARAMT